MSRSSWFPVPSLLLLVWAALFWSGCGDGTGPGADGPQSLALEVPEYASEGQAFRLRVTAHGADPAAPLAGFAGTVSLTVSSGSITPATVQLVGGVGAVDATITGAAGEVTVRGVAAAVDGQAALRVLASDQLLQGQPGDPAEAAIPLLDLAARAADYSDDHPDLPGFFLSFNTLTLEFELGTTVAGANAVLAPLDARIVGGIPGVAGQARGLLVLRLPTTSHAAMEATLVTLRANAAVRSAMQNMLVSTAALPAGGSGRVEQWSWERTPAGGNYGLEMIRAPYLWNLNRKVEGSTVTGIVDVGFVDHEDLTYLADLTPAGFTAAADDIDHGVHVAGIVAAGFDNGRGVDGVNPFARLVVHPASRPADASALPPGLTDLSNANYALYQVIRHPSRPRVVNISMAWRLTRAGKPPINPLGATWQLKATAGGQHVITVLDALRAAGHTIPLIVTAAGNNGGAPARWTSAWNTAALHYGQPDILVVESVAPAAGGGATKSSFSDVGGHVSAPGGERLSNGGPQVWSAGFTEPYVGMQGTSQAAPHVAGLAGYLLALDPQLTSAQLRDLLTSQGATVPAAGGASRRIDAYAAVLDIDRLRGDDRILRLLLDLDDGTPDGNTRIDPLDGSVVTAHAGGDGRVDMRDFRRWRDGWLYLADPPELALDGAADHPKKDLNGNGIVHPDDEFLFPFVDLNGDTLVDASSRAALPGLGSVTDLEMIQKLFDDPHYEPAQLDSLLFSADIAIRPATLRAAGQAAHIHSSVRPEGQAAAPDERRFRRVHTGDEVQGEGLWQVYTVPSYDDDGGIRRYTARVVGLSAGGDTIFAVERSFEAKPGQDHFWDPGTIQVTLIPTDATVAPGRTQQFTATVSGTENQAVAWLATGGTITSGGLYTAGSTPGSYTVTATSVAAPAATATAAVIIPAPAAVVPLWHQSLVNAIAYQTQDRVDADSAAFAGFSASVTAEDAGQEAKADQTTTTDYDPATGTLSFLESSGGSRAVTRRPGEGGGWAMTRVRLLFEVRDEPVDFAFTASCSVQAGPISASSNFHVTLEKRDPPNQYRRYINVDIGEEEPENCAGVEVTRTLPVGTYLLEADLTSGATVWDDEGEGSGEGRYTFRLEFR
jgi:subtilisin family serine protease